MAIWGPPLAAPPQPLLALPPRALPLFWIVTPILRTRLVGTHPGAICPEAPAEDDKVSNPGANAMKTSEDDESGAGNVHGTFLSDKQP